MDLVIYNGPIGDPIENPSIDFIKNIVFNKEADYWLKGSGDSCIEVAGAEERLIFFFDEPYGFFIMQHPDYLAPYDETADIKAVEHRVGGEPMTVPSCCYVSREKAFEILYKFIVYKEIDKNVNWIDIYEVDFDHGY